MSNRFHSKFHRSNHHTYGIEVNPDTGHDPIASRDLPFRGDFILQGALSAMARLSAYAGYFYCNNTALCAWAGNRGAYVFAADNLGLEIQCLYNTAISARAHNIGVETLSDRIALSAYGLDYGIITGSPKIALSANGIKVGIDAFSPNFAISAFGGVRGIDVASNDIALSAWGNNTAGVFASPHFAISAYGFDRGIEVASNNVGISSWGGNAAGIFISDVVALSTNSYNLDGYPNKNNPYFGPNYKSKNVLNNRTGIFTENPLSAFHVTGGSLFDGHVTVTGNLSVAGDLSRFDTYVFVTSSTQIILNNSSNTEPALYVSNTGNNRVVEFYDADSSVTPTRPSFVVDGNTNRPGNVGINVGLPNEKLTILGNISAQGNLSATYIHITPFLGTYTALPNTRAAFTSYANSYSQVNHQNLFTGNNASSDFIATTDNGTDSTGYIDLGINNSSYNQYEVFDIVGSNGGYLYTQGGDLAVGTGAAKNLVFFTGATLSANERMRIDSLGNINIGNTITGVGDATLKVKGQTDINISGSATTNIATTLNTGALTIGNSTGVLSALGSTIYLNKDAGANVTNIGNGTTTGAVSIGNSTGVLSALGSTIYLNKDAGDNVTNIGNGTTTGAVSIGNSTGTLTINGNDGNITTASTLSINTTAAKTTDINTGSGVVTTTIGNAGTVTINAATTNIGTVSGALNLGNTSGILDIKGSYVKVSGDVNINNNSLSSRNISLIHGNANDGVNPYLFLGEMGGVAGTNAGITSGFNIGYNEGQNKLYISTKFGDGTVVPPVTAMTIDQTGTVTANTGVWSPVSFGVTTTNGFDFKAAAYDTKVYTVPTGKTFIPESITYIFDSANAGGNTDTLPKMRLYKNSGGTTGLSTAFTPTANTGNYSPPSYVRGSLTVNPVSTNNTAATNGDSVYLKIDIAYSGTSTTNLSGKVIINGWLI
jgi:hypothetical protein